MSRALDDLALEFRALAKELLARCVEARIPVLIVDTLRTPERHAELLAAGRSWTQHSRHLDGLAIDIAPYYTYALYGEDKLQWDAEDPVWKRLGTIGERAGLRWGGRWKQRDLGHFEMPGQAGND